MSCEYGCILTSASKSLFPVNRNLFYLIHAQNSSTNVSIGRLFVPFRRCKLSTPPLHTSIYLFLLLLVPTKCGGFVVAHDNLTFSIQSENYPWPYRKAKSCSWRVCPPQGKKLQFNFSTFDLRTFDSLEIINGERLDFITTIKRSFLESRLKGD